MSDQVRVLEPFDFHGQALIVVDNNGEPYVAMKPVVEGMGLDWGGQHKKLADESSRWSISVISILQSHDGRQRDMTCLPLRKLTAWLMILQPSRMAPEVADRVRFYQEECDGALWAYWSKGVAINPRAETSLTRDDILLQALQSLVEKEKKISALEQGHLHLIGRVDTIEKRAQEATGQLLALPLPDESVLGLSTRAKVVRVVRVYCRESGVAYPEAWGCLYREFRDRYHVDLVRRARNEGSSPLDVAEDLEAEGYICLLGDLYAVAYDMFVTKTKSA